MGVYMGPVELLVVSFPGNRFKGEIAPALSDLVKNGTIRIIDLAFIMKDSDGTVTAIELQDTDEETKKAVGPIADQISGLLSMDDIEQVGDVLDNNSSAAALLFEDTWATQLRDALVNAGGQFVALERIPNPEIEQAMAAHAAEAAQVAS
jgi:hypothetical protein